MLQGLIAYMQRKREGEMRKIFIPVRNSFPEDIDCLCTHKKSNITTSIWVPTSNFPRRLWIVVTSCVSQEYSDLNNYMEGSGSATIK